MTLQEDILYITIEMLENKNVNHIKDIGEIVDKN